MGQEETDLDLLVIIQRRPLTPTDDWSFWTVQEYAAPVQIQSGSIVNRWGTVIARIRPNP